MPQDNAGIPSGIIAMWSGASNAIPTGWVLCDGDNNTPDLRNRFIVGAGSTYSVGNTGGSDTVTLNSSQLPRHTHSVNLTAASNGAHAHSHTFSINFSGLTCSSAGGHSHTLDTVIYHDRWGGMDGADGISGKGTLTTSWAGDHTHNITGNGTLSGSISSGGAHTHSVSGNTGSVGSGSSHENRPPYYALCFIMKQ